MKISTYVKFGLVFLGLWLVLVLVLEEQQLVALLESITANSSVNDPAATVIKLTIAMVLGWVLLSVAWRTWRARVVMTGLRSTSRLERLELSGIAMLLLLFLVGISVMGPFRSLEDAGWLTRGTLHGEDGPLETLTVVCALVACALLLANGKGYSVLSRILIYLVAVAAFLFGMEEMSWGQRILGVETPAVFVEKNVQEELNLHNFLSPRTIHLHLPVFINLVLLIYFCFASWFSHWLPHDLRFATAPPHALALSLAFQVLAVQSFVYWSAEVTEEALSLLLLFFGLKVRQHRLQLQPVR